MPSFQNPIARPQLPFRHEGSNLRHLRDGDSIGREWQKASKDNSVLRANGEALNRLQRTVAGLRKPKFVMDRWHPFKIYNVPPNLCANAADSWRTFRVRAGLVSYRTPFGPEPYLNGVNYSTVLPPATGSDGVGLSSFSSTNFDPPNGYQDQMILSYTQGTYETVSVPDTGTSGVTSTGAYAEFVLNDALDGVNERAAEFWIQINDPNDRTTHDQEITAEIRCRMCTSNPTDARPPVGYQLQSPKIIPIGYVVVRRGSDPEPLLDNPAIGYRVQQYLYDHVVQRYATGYYDELPMAGDNKFTTTPMVFRGDYDDNDLSEATYWPGDAVSRHGVLGDAVTSWRAVYVWNTIPTNSPPAPDLMGGNSGWSLFSYSQYV